MNYVIIGVGATFTASYITIYATIDIYVVKGGGGICAFTADDMPAYIARDFYVVLVSVTFANTASYITSYITTDNYFVVCGGANFTFTADDMSAYIARDAYGVIVGLCFSIATSDGGVI